MNDSTKLLMREMLFEFDDTTLYSLATTITSGLLKNKIDSREGAIQAILNYSSDPHSFLRRKAITKETLFAYMHKHNININLPAKKIELIANIIDYWNSTINLNQNVSMAECSSQPDEAPVTVLAEQFCSWFYGMMNGEGISPEHFYPDAKMKINTVYPNGSSDVEFIEGNPQELAAKLYNIRISHNLYFNPNLTSEGVQGRVDPHGLVIILACGTLHVNNMCAGIFQQVFGLIRDPCAANNWKIKLTELNLTSEGALSPPKLCESDLTSQYLSLPMI